MLHNTMGSWSDRCVVCCSGIHWSVVWYSDVDWSVVWYHAVDWSVVWYHFLVKETLLLVVLEVLGRVFSPFSLDHINVFLNQWFGYFCPLETFNVCVKPPGFFVEIYPFRAGLEYEFHLCVG